jgi:hypothetical protein
VAACNSCLIPRSHSNKVHISHNKMIYIYIYSSVRIRYLLPLTMEIPSMVGCGPREDYIQGESTKSLRVTIWIRMSLLFETFATFNLTATHYAHAF